MSLNAKTQNARAKTLTNSSGRWSIDHGKGLEDLYANAKGSVFTNFGAGNLPAGATSPGLNEQIGSGMNRSKGGQSFFGFGRGNTRSSVDTKNLGTENVAGYGESGSKQVAPKQRGTGGVLGFTTFRVPMTDHDYGKNKDGVEALAKSSWFTQGLFAGPGKGGLKKYGSTMTGLGNRSSSTGRTDGGAGVGKQSRDNVKKGGDYQ